MEKSLTKLAEKGRRRPRRGPSPARSPSPSSSRRIFCIEAVVEDAAVTADDPPARARLFPADAILASNTSSIPITSLAAVTYRPDKVIGMHFFNPVPVLKLVEVIRALQTSDETAAAIVALAEDLGKTPAEANDFPGFVSNRILMPFVNEAVYALMEGVAEAEAIDTIATLGFAHPMGPLPSPTSSGWTRAWRSWTCSTRDSATRSTRRARFCASTSPLVGWPEVGPGFYEYS